MPASVLHSYVLSIDRGAKHQGIFATEVDTYRGSLPNHIWYIVWWVRDYPSFFVSLDEFVDPDFRCCIPFFGQAARNLDVTFPDAGRREFFASHNQSTSSSTAEPLSKGREICTITSRKTMIHDPDTLTFNSVDIYDELRRACDILCRLDDKGLGLSLVLRNS